MLNSIFSGFSERWDSLTTVDPIPIPILRLIRQFRRFLCIFLMFSRVGFQEQKKPPVKTVPATDLPIGFLDEEAPFSEASGTMHF